MGITCNTTLKRHRTTIVMSYSSPRHSQNFYQYDASTPPPPPPKPGRSSGTATPSQGPPLPPPPPGQASSGNPQTSQAQYQQYAPTDAEQLVIQPPDNGWLPDVLKDKPYVSPGTLTRTLLSRKQDKGFAPCTADTRTAECVDLQSRNNACVTACIHCASTGTSCAERRAGRITQAA